MERLKGPVRSCITVHPKGLESNVRVLRQKAPDLISLLRTRNAQYENKIFQYKSEVVTERGTIDPVTGND